MARINISTGPITQFCSKERPRIFLFRKTSPNSSYRTFARGGYILRVNPNPMGIEVVPTLKWFRKGTIPGRTQPATTPTSMAVKIQSVRYRSRKLRRIVVCIREPPRPTPSAKGIRFLEMQTRLYTSDIVDFFLERETVNAGESKAEKQTDSALEHKKSLSEGPFHLRFRAPHRCRIGHTPMGSHGLARPHRADFIGCIVTDRKNNIELLSIGSLKSLPAFTS